MIDTPRIIQTTTQLTAMIHLVIPRLEIQKVMEPCLQEIKTALAKQGIAATGPWFTHHLRMDPQAFDFEICLPVKTPIKPVGRVQPGSIPAAKVAQTTYHGPYEGLGNAWGELLKWVSGQGLKPALDLWEVYAAGPESGPDPKAWRTELSKPILP